MTDKPTYKAGCSITFIAQECDVNQLNQGKYCLVERYQIIKHEPAPEPKKWERWVAMTEGESVCSVSRGTKKEIEQYARYFNVKILSIIPVTLVEGEGL